MLIFSSILCLISHSFSHFSFLNTLFNDSVKSWSTVHETQREFLRIHRVRTHTWCMNANINNSYVYYLLFLNAKICFSCNWYFKIPYSRITVVNVLEDNKKKKKGLICLPGNAKAFVRYSGGGMLKKHITFCIRRFSLYWKAPVLLML